MTKHSTWLISVLNKWPLIILLCITLSTAIVFLNRASFDGSCNSQSFMDDNNQIHSKIAGTENPLTFMKSKLVVLVSHELSLYGHCTGGTTEIVVDGTTGWLHPAGKEGVTPLAKNIVRLATDVETRLKMGKKGSARVKEMFLEQHMSQRISLVLKEVLKKAKKNAKGLK